MTSCVGLGLARVAGQAALLPQPVEAAGPAGDHLVDVRLVAGVPEDPVVRRVEDPVQGQGQLDDAEVRTEVAPGARHRGDEELADLLGQRLELRRSRRRRSRGPRIVSSRPIAAGSRAGSSSGRVRHGRGPVRAGTRRVHGPASQAATNRRPRSASSTRPTARSVRTRRAPSRSYAATAAATVWRRRRRAGRRAPSPARAAPPRCRPARGGRRTGPAPPGAGAAPRGRR